MPFYCGKRAAAICVVLIPKKSSTYSSEYASGFFVPAASHLPASPSPCNEGLLGQAPSRLLKKVNIPPAPPQCVKTRLFPIVIFGSKESSTGTQPPHPSTVRTDAVLLIRGTVRPRGFASGSFSPAARHG